MADEGGDNLFEETTNNEETKDNNEEQDDLFGDTTVISLDNDEKKPEAEAEKQESLFDNETETEETKSKAEKEEEESGDEFDINIKVSDPEKIGDGMSSYMAYRVTTMTSIPTFKSSEFVVKRRFSDFLGLHERLQEKHLPFGRVVPPAPEKSVMGMTKVKMSKDDSGSSEFVERRKASLERYLNRTARHPELRNDPDFKQFLEAEELPRATNTSALSKGGIGRLFKNVGEAVSKMTTKMTEGDQWFETKHNEIETLDVQLKKLHQATESFYVLRKDLSLNTSQFAKSCAMLSNSEEHPGLSRALTNLAELEEKIEQLQEEQAHVDFYVLCETVKEYVGLIQSVKASFQQRIKVWQVWQSAQVMLTKKRETLVKLELSGKQDKILQAKEEVKEWEMKVEKGEEDFGEISKSVKAEVKQFESHRVKDLKDLIIKYLESLLTTQQELVKYWETFLPEAKAIA